MSLDDEIAKLLASEKDVVWHEHKWRGGPPPLRTRRMQLQHEVRARRLGVYWEMVDLRDVYAAASGRCGICHTVVPEDSFTVDHIVPLSRGGR